MLIYLTGFMGSGKSHVGKKLANSMSLQFIDLDDMIEQKHHITIPSLFEKYDENAFRKLEHETLKETLHLADTLVSTGGGTPCYHNNMALINQHGFSIYLKLHPLSLLDRLTNSKKKRPLIKQLSKEELLQFIEDKLAEREFFYLQSKLVYKGENLNIEDLQHSIHKHLITK